MSAIRSQITTVQAILTSGVAKKMTRRSQEADLIQDHLRGALETLAWVERHEDTIKAAIAAQRGSR